MRDRFNGCHTATDSGALAAYERAVSSLAGHRPDVATALDEATTQAPDFIAAHALRGFGYLTMGRAELVPEAESSLAAVRLACELNHDVTPMEAALASALAVAVEGRFLDAADRLECHLVAEPRDFLSLKLAHALRFMAGDAQGMLVATSSVVAKWDRHEDGAGYVFGCHAFGLEEAGRYTEAERFAEEALALAPDDAWGLHALSHIDEMNGRLSEGIARLEAGRTVWTRCNNFKHHMAWHLAFLHLEAGDVGRALELYDAEIRPLPTDDYRDVANAASMLWRLRLSGIAVGDRWSELAELAHRRAADTTLMFASLHHMLSLAASGDHFGLARVLEAWEHHAATGVGDQAWVASEVGLNMARAIAGQTQGLEFARLAHRLPRLGGSFAQRDVFLQILVAAAEKDGDRRSVDAILRLRHDVRGHDRFAKRISYCHVA